jgi:cell division protein FtsB
MTFLTRPPQAGTNLMHMRQILLTLSLFAFCLSFTACGGKESAASVAKKWCELNGKAYKAAEGAEKEAAEAAREKFEKEMEEKYKDDKPFMEEVGKEVEKCEDASEGR